MSATSSLFLAAIVLLVVAGAQKTADPMPAVGALRSVGVRASATTVRVAALAEVFVGVAAAVTGQVPVVLAVAATYAAFTGFVLAALRKGTMVSSCGCFGHVDTPPSVVHVVVNAVLSATAVAWALRQPGISSIDGLFGAPGAGVPFLAVTALLIATVYVSLTDLPRTMAVVSAVRADRQGSA